jgi:hypothetical protein
MPDEGALRTHARTQKRSGHWLSMSSPLRWMDHVKQARVRIIACVLRTQHLCDLDDMPDCNGMCGR